MSRKRFLGIGGALAISAGLGTGCASTREALDDSGGGSVPLRIGTQNATTNTVTSGIVLRQMGFLEKFLPQSGKYRGAEYDLGWFDSPSAPPITNQMVAGKVDIAGMGDYPLLVNGSTFQKMGNERSFFIATIAYNARGSGNGVVVPQDSDISSLEDLEGKNVSVPLGSAAHGMLIRALSEKDLSPESFFNLTNQQPSEAAASLKAGKIDAHADFVPYAELFPFQGFARKVFDGSQVGVPTFHGITVREGFADENPEVVVGYLRALLAANSWVAENPQEAAEKIEEWTGVAKEVVYVFLGRQGIMTLDPTIKPRWVETMKKNVPMLRSMDALEDIDIDAFVRDDFVRTAFEKEGLDYDRQLQQEEPHALISGTDPVSGDDITDHRSAGEIWPADGPIEPFSSPSTLLTKAKELEGQGKKVNASYVTDHNYGVKLFADDAFYVETGEGSGGDTPAMVAFGTQPAAAAFARQRGGAVLPYQEAIRRA